MVILESASLGKEVPGAVLGVWACGKVNPSFKKKMPRWWFQRFFIFTPIWGNDPI